jgi:hypothetical protein
VRYRHLSTYSLSEFLSHHSLDGQNNQLTEWTNKIWSIGSYQQESQDREEKRREDKRKKEKDEKETL